MEHSVAESKSGLYDVYYTGEGKKLVVLEGLDPNDQFEPPYLQQKISEHYEVIAVLYWVLFVATIGYVTYMYIIKPLLRRRS
jgi:hypothetical protein